MWCNCALVNASGVKNKATKVTVWSKTVLTSFFPKILPSVLFISDSNYNLQSLVLFRFYRISNSLRMGGVTGVLAR